MSLFKIYTHLTSISPSNPNDGHEKFDGNVKWEKRINNTLATRNYRTVFNERLSDTDDDLKAILINTIS